MRKKIWNYILILLIVIATIDFVIAYAQDEKLELYNLGATYLACWIGLRALSEIKIRGLSDRVDRGIYIHKLLFVMTMN